MLRRSFLALALTGVMAAPSESGHGCHRCGCSKVRKVCVPVQEIVKETTYEYACKCEDFCVPGPSKCVGTQCVKDCNGCCTYRKVMQATCAKAMTKSVLIKIPVVKEKCVTKWVVKTVCCGCGHACGTGNCAEGCGPGCTSDGAAPVPTQAPLPPSPVKQASAETELLPSPLFDVR